MNYGFFFVGGFWLLELLATAAVIFPAAYFWRAKPDRAIARLLRHRDRIWFALLLLFVPMVALHYLVFHFIERQPMREPSLIPQILNLTFAVLNGTIYGLAGCWFSSPAKKEGRFNYGLAFMVAIALLVLISLLSVAVSSFRVAPTINVPVILAVIVSLAFIGSRLFARKNLKLQQETVINNTPTKTKFDPAFAFIWLFVGLLPIPILLVAASSKPSGSLPPALGIAMLIICLACNLLGAFGCLGGIKNIAVRVVLGIFLAVFFFGLSVLVALLQACSHSGGI